MRHLCHESVVAEGSSRGFDPHGSGGDTVFLLRHQGTLRAWKNSCPHMAGAPMAWRKDAYMNAAGTLITCHAHGALFAPDTGVCVQGPCLGKSLTGLALEIDSHGEVFVQAHDNDVEETGTWQR